MSHVKKNIDKKTDKSRTEKEIKIQDPGLENPKKIKAPGKKKSRKEDEDNPRKRK